MGDARGATDAAAAARKVMHQSPRVAGPMRESVRVGFLTEDRQENEAPDLRSLCFLRVESIPALSCVSCFSWWLYSVSLCLGGSKLSACSESSVGLPEPACGEPVDSVKGSAVRPSRKSPLPDPASSICWAHEQPRTCDRDRAAAPSRHSPDGYRPGNRAAGRDRDCSRPSPPW
jgi:hypothetical protein